MITKYGKVTVGSVDGSELATCRVEGFEGETSTVHRLNIEAIKWAIEKLNYALRSQLSVTEGAACRFVHEEDKTHAKV